MCSERKPPIIQNHNGASSSMKEEANVVLERTYEKESGAKKSKGGKPKKISIKEKAKKKAAIKLTAIITAAVLGIILVAGGILVLSNINNPDSVFYDFFGTKKPLTPKNLRVENFDSQKDFVLLLRWDKIRNAESYTVEVVYDLYPDDTISHQVYNDGIFVERKRGTLKYRVKASNKRGSSDFTQWATYYVIPLELEKPDLNWVREGDSVIINWNSLKYKYFNEEKEVTTYELVDGAYWLDEPANIIENPPLFTPNEEYIIDLFKGGEYIGDVLIIKIRAVNYTYRYGMGRINDPPELYNIYQSSEWTVVEIPIGQLD